MLGGWRACRLEEKCLPNQKKWWFIVHDVCVCMIKQRDSTFSSFSNEVRLGSRCRQLERTEHFFFSTELITLEAAEKGQSMAEFSDACMTWEAVLLYSSNMSDITTWARLRPAHTHTHTHRHTPTPSLGTRINGHALHKKQKLRVVGLAIVICLPERW